MDDTFYGGGQHKCDKCGRTIFGSGLCDCEMKPEVQSDAFKEMDDKFGYKKQYEKVTKCYVMEAVFSDDECKYSDEYVDWLENKLGNIQRF